MIRAVAQVEELPDKYIIHPPRKKMNTDAEILNRLIRGRRSVFQDQFAGTSVPDQIIAEMLENANWAPTHKFTEPWRFIVFTGNGIVQLATAQADLYKKVSTRKAKFDEKTFNKLLSKPQMSSHIIAVAMKRDEKHSVPEIEESGAVFCAVQNMLLTAWAYGVGAYLSTGGITYIEEAKELFQLSAEDRLIGFIHVGNILNEVRPGRRKPIDEKVNWVK